MSRSCQTTVRAIERAHRVGHRREQANARICRVGPMTSGPDHDEAPDAAVLQARLRQVRRQSRLTLNDVAEASDHEFKASVLGAYERGERAISVSRLHRLARLYQVPVAELIHDRERWEGEGHAPVCIDLAALRQFGGPQGLMLGRYVRAIEVDRGDYNGRILTIRRGDLRIVATILGCEPDRAHARLSDLGLCHDG
jgi:transcriptional regulator with XRE-family HTH domain